MQAKEILPVLLNILNKYSSDILVNNQAELKQIIHFGEILKDWKFDMIGNDKRALIYNLWVNELFRKILSNSKLSQNEIENIIDLAPNLIGFYTKSWEKDEELDNDLCKMPGNLQKYSCAYLIVTSLLSVHKYMLENYGRNEKNWQWEYENKQIYYHPIYSENLLKYIFQRESHVPVFSIFS